MIAWTQPNAVLHALRRRRPTKKYWEPAGKAGEDLIYPPMQWSKCTYASSATIMYARDINTKEMAI